MSESLTPVAVHERIATLDVVRGFALLGIFLMNVEFFNRPLSDLDSGLPLNVTGIDYWAGWFVHVFVRGKFWTMFSLLFGMGFAVMLTRAEQAGRDFLKPYLRRTLALATFGTLHYIFLWAGDILSSYAMGAAFLLVVFYGRPKWLLVAAVVSLVCAAVLGGLTAAGVAKLPWPPFLLLGVPMLLFGVVALALRRAPLDALRNAGLALYLVPCLALMVGGALSPHQTQAERDRIALSEAKTPAEKAEVRKSLEKEAKARKEKADEIAAEARITSRGSYADVVAWRASHFLGNAGRETPFAMVFVLGMFLLGAWFVRSGVMIKPAAHLELFRALTLYSLPLGLGISLIAAATATTRVEGQNEALFTFSTGLSLAGNLATCLGYIGGLVLLFHSRMGGIAAMFAPAGRMALTNYLMQSLVGTTFFYGYGLAHWGMGRAQQLLFVLVVFALQIAISHWWLARFRYGPMEWLWRSATYLRMPAMRQGALQSA
ncbi:MAG TPA: DUF418 domain-containing protein [Lysobacter sp.]|nr:DUF418 domain-containing protein [Lysobacter sp.]